MFQSRSDQSAKMQSGESSESSESSESFESSESSESYESTESTESLESVGSSIIRYIMDSEPPESVHQNDVELINVGTDQQPYLIQSLRAVPQINIQEQEGDHNYQQVHLVLGEQSPQDQQELLNARQLGHYSISAEWEVHSIIDHYISAGIIYYRVRWSPLGEWEDTWEPGFNCSCDGMIRQYFENKLIFGTNESNA